LVADNGKGLYPWGGVAGELPTTKDDPPVRRAVGAARAVLWACAALVGVLVVLAVGACGAPEEAKPRPLPDVTRKLDPGTYRTEWFEPAFSFRVGGGWTYLPLGSKPDDLALARGQTGLRFFKVREVFKPDERYEVVEAPNDLVGWLRRHPYLRTSAPQTVTVGGVEGKRFDVSVGDLPQDYSGECGPDCVAQFRLSDGTVLGISKGEKARGIVLEDVGGDTVAIGFGGPADEVDEHAPEAQKVIDTVQWKRP
jgi:hypothetical protein